VKFFYDTLKTNEAGQHSTKSMKELIQ